MLCWVLVEQAGHEHISDEYKNVRYNIIVLLKSASWVNQTIRDHHMVPSELTRVC